MKINSQNIKALVRQRNSIGILALLLGVSNLILSVALFFHAEKTIILPPEQKVRVWFQGNNVSRAYLEEMALFFGHLLLDKNDSNAAFQHKMLLKYIHPSATNKVIGMLNADYKRYQKEGLNTSFYPKKILADMNGKSVTLEGKFVARVGQRKVSEENKKYIFVFSNSQSHWYLTTFKEILDEK